MNRRVGYALAGFALWAACATAEQATRNVGDWVVTAEGDPSGRGRVIAQLVQPPLAVAVRCLGHDLSITLAKPTAASPGPMSPDATYTIQFRADQNGIINTYAIGLSDTAKRMVAQIADAKEFTFRVMSNSGTTETWAFKAGAAKRALADVVEQCPVD
jgi:hypothetical protein